MSYTYQTLTNEIIGAAIEVHKTLGPGLLESTYEICLAHEFARRNIPFLRQVPLEVKYKEQILECGYRLDFLVSNVVIVELKTVEKLLPIHESQLLTYLKLSHKKIGLIMNFNTTTMKTGIKRLIA